MLRNRRFAVSTAAVGVIMAVCLALSAICPAQAGEGWKPSRTVTIFCWSAAGGFTDLCNRALAASFSEQFGVPFNVTNMIGGGGATAANHIWNLPRDGYSILGASDGLHAMGVRGGFTQPNNVWDVMFLISAKGAISVREDSPYKTFDDLLAAMKASTMKSGASQAGSVWMIKLAQVIKLVGTNLTILPFEGSNQTLVSLLAGEIDIALCGLAEQEDYIRAGKVRPLAMIEPEDFNLPQVGNIPSIAKWYPEFATMKQAMQWGGIAFPVDTPKEILDAYHAAFQVAVNSKPVQDFAVPRNIAIVNVTGEDAKKLVAENDSVYAWTIFDAGLAVKSPEEFGIPRP